MASEEHAQLNQQVRQLDPNPTRADGYIRDANLATRVLQDIMAQPWPGQGAPRLDIRWGYVPGEWEVLLYDFVQDGDPGDGLGRRPYFHTIIPAGHHKSQAIALCQVIVAIAAWKKKN